MAFTSKLATLFVDFLGRGQEKLKADTDKVQKDLQNVARVASSVRLPSVQEILGPLLDTTKATNVGNVIEPLKKKSEESAKSWQGLAASAGLMKGHVAGIVASLTGIGSVSALIFGGFAQSNLANLMNFRIQELSRTMAGFFRPEFEKAIALVEKFNKLMEHPSAQFSVSLLATPFNLIEQAIERLLAVLDKLAAKLEKIGKEPIQDGSVMQSFMAGAAPPLQGWVQGLLQGAGITGDRSALPPRTTGFESAENAYRRVAEASIKMGLGEDIPKATLDTLKESKDIQQGMLNGIMGIKPAGVP